MDQLTWMFGFLPSWFWNVLLILSLMALIASWVLKFIPFIGTYRLPLQVIGIIAAITSVWFLGAASNEAKWKLKVTEAEAKAKEAQILAQKLNHDLSILADKKTVIREEKTKTITKYIDSWITKEITKTVEGPERIKIEKIIEYIERCPIPKELLDIHNQAAKGEEMKK
jgi:hypothetical protein